MKEDIKQINKQFRNALLMFLGVLIIMAAIAAVTALLLPEAYAYVVYFILLIAFVFIGPRFRSELEQISNVSYIVKIRANAANPLKIKHLSQANDVTQWLRTNDYIRFIHDETHDLFYKIMRDTNQKVFRRYILEVVVIVHTRKEKFYLPQVDDEIHKILDIVYKDKKRIHMMMITQFRRIEKLDEQLKQKIREIVFVRTKKGIISTINVGLHDASNQAVLLYADDYSPSIYYRLHTDEIKKLI